MKRRKVVHFRRKLRHLAAEYGAGEINLEKVDASVQGWVNYVRYADSWGLRRDVLGSVRL